MVTIFETIVEPLLTPLKEEADLLKNDAKLYNLAFVHFSEPFGIYFRLPRQSRYGLRLGHDRPSPER